MKASIADALPHFRKDVTHVKQDAPLWKELKILLDKFRWQYIANPRHEDVGWHHTEGGEGQSGDTCDTWEDEGTSDDNAAGDYSRGTHTVNRAIKDFFLALHTALISDMMNGEGKEFVEQLTRIVEMFLGISADERFIKFTTPPTSTRQNTKIEMVAPEDTANWDRPYSTEPPEAKVLPCQAHIDGSPMPWPEQPVRKLAVEKAALVVPDVTWALPDFPGQFPLVVELKPDAALAEGLTQCCKEMLSKFFFQSAVFGLLLTQRHFILLFAHKREDNTIQVHQQIPINLGTQEFSSESLVTLVELLCKIMDWAGRMSGYRK